MNIYPLGNPNTNVNHFYWAYMRQKWHDHNVLQRITINGILGNSGLLNKKLVIFHLVEINSCQHSFKHLA